MKKLQTILLLCLSVLLLSLVCGGNPAVNAEENQEEARSPIPIETVTVDSFSMNYFKFGHGEKTFVLIPGLSVQGVMGAAEQITSAYQTMTDDFTIYVFDPRNELPSSYDIPEMAEDTAKVIKKLGLDHFCIMGASMGGMVSLEIAVHHPELIDKMVLASTAVQVGEEQFQTLDQWIQLAQEGDSEALYLAFGEAVYPKEIFEQSRESLIEASETVTEEQLKHFVVLAESMRGFDITDDMDKIECPILAVNDQEDLVLGIKAVETMESYMNQRPDWDFYLYDGYGHALYDTAPDFKERILEFFQK